jgi:o-succinylbenzoate synthase
MRYRFSYKVWRKEMRTPLRTAHGLWAEREGIFVRLESETGHVGYGEIAPIPSFGTETMEEAAEVLRGFGDRVDDAQLDLVDRKFGCARFALAAARNQEGASAQTRTPRLPVAALLPAGRAALDALPDKLGAGFLSLKWKVGVGRADEELGILDDLLAHVPEYVRLRIDANGSWDRRTAERWLSTCAERPIEFVEQPCAPDDADLLLGLATDYPVKMALDESVASLDSARGWQQRGWPGVFVIKPALAGPLPELLSWATTTKPDLVISSAIESALARAQFLRAVLTAGVTSRALGVGVGGIFGDRHWDGPATGALIDAAWCDSVSAEELWNATN